METGNITKEREDIKINQIEILGLIYNKPKKKKKKSGEVQSQIEYNKANTQET